MLERIPEGQRPLQVNLSVDESTAGTADSDLLPLRQGHGELDVPIRHLRPDRTARSLVQTNKAIPFHRAQGAQGARQIARRSPGGCRQVSQRFRPRIGDDAEQGPVAVGEHLLQSSLAM